MEGLNLQSTENKKKLAIGRKLDGQFLAIAWVLLLRNADFARYLSWGPVTSIEESISFLSDTMFRHQLGDVAGWGLVKKRENRIIGTCGFTNWDPESKKAEIGYALARDHWGQGYITETVNQVIDYGCRSMELNRIEGMCDAEN
mgnify:CR=1 FL=1